MPRFSKLSVIIPVYNEKACIKIILKKVRKVRIPIGKEIIVVDDCSTDGTKDILRREKGIRVFYHEKNRGKGGAIRTGLSKCTGGLVIFQDGDLEYDPADYPKLLKPILSGKTDVVYGSRFLDRRTRKRASKGMAFHYFGNRMLTLFTNILYGQRLTDMETCYKVFRQDIIKKLGFRSNGFEMEPEITAKVLKRGHAIIEIPIKYYPRDFQSGKKITWRDGVKAAYYLLKYRFRD